MIASIYFLKIRPFLRIDPFLIFLILYSSAIQISERQKHSAIQISERQKHIK